MKLIAAVLFLALFGVSSSNAKSIRAGKLCTIAIFVTFVVLVFSREIGEFHFQYRLSTWYFKIFFFYEAPITDEELLALSKNLHINDVNGVVVELDLQAKTTIGDLSDKAPSR